MRDFTIPLVGYPEENFVFKDEEIRDVVAHNSSIANMTRYKIISIYVANTLDQIISIQVRANQTKSTTGATDVGGAFNVAATTGIEARVLTPDTTGWLPYIYAIATATGLPTTGDLNVTITGRN